MLQELKVLLGAAASNFSDAQIGLCLKMALAEVEAYCNRNIDYELEMVVIRIAIIKLERLGSEAVESESYSGATYNYIDGYPADIQSILRRKRRIRVV